MTVDVMASAHPPKLGNQSPHERLEISEKQRFERRQSQSRANSLRLFKRQPHPRELRHRRPDRSLCIHGSVTSTNSQRPKPPWLFTAGTQSVRAVVTFATLSFRASPVTRRSNSGRRGPAEAGHYVRVVARQIRLKPDLGDEVGVVVLLLAVQRVRNREAELWFFT